jgi:hypothetical protein
LYGKWRKLGYITPDTHVRNASHFADITIRNRLRLIQTQNTRIWWPPNLREIFSTPVYAIKAAKLLKATELLGQFRSLDTVDQAEQ